MAEEFASGGEGREAVVFSHELKVGGHGLPAVDGEDLPRKLPFPEEYAGDGFDERVSNLWDFPEAVCLLLKDDHLITVGHGNMLI